MILNINSIIFLTGQMFLTTTSYLNDKKPNHIILLRFFSKDKHDRCRGFTEVEFRHCLVFSGSWMKIINTVLCIYIHGPLNIQ